MMGRLLLWSAALVVLWLGMQRRREEEEVIAGSPAVPRPPRSLTIEDLYRDTAVRFRLNPRLIQAIAIVESGENPRAVNPADPSYGLMQILCIPDGKGGCSNRFNLPDWPPARAEDLYDPEYNLSLAGGILRWNLERYGFPRGIAMYNAFGARLDPPQGPFRNQGYVDKVLAQFNALGGGSWQLTNLRMEGLDIDQFNANVLLEI